MNTATITLDGTAQQLSALANIPHRIRWLKIKNPTGNSDLFIGSAGEQTYTIAAGDPGELFPLENLKNIWVRGTNTDTINILYA